MAKRKDSSRIVWWHFSDLHWQAGQSTERNQFLTTLSAHAKENIRAYGKPDFMVLSGDTSFSGSEEQFQEAKREFFDALKAVCGDQSMLFFLVPGNHDLSRQVSKYTNPEPIRSIKSVSQLTEFLDDSTAREMLTRPFAEYEAFCKTVAPQTGSEIMSWSKTMEVKGQTVRIVGVNTAWASGYHLDEHGRAFDERNLLLGVQQLAASESSGQKVQLSLLIMHHPLNWLQGVVENHIKHIIQKNFDFVLFGHVHTVQDIATTLSPAGQCIYLPSPATYNRPGAGGVEYARGYNIVVLDVARKKGQAHYFKYTEEFGAKFVPFIELYQEGKSSYELRLDVTAEEPGSPVAYDSYEEIIQQFPDLGKMDSVLPDFVLTKGYQRHTVDLYDQICIDFVRANGLVEIDCEQAFWEAFTVNRALLILQLAELKGTQPDHEKYDQRKPSRSLVQFLERVAADGDINLFLDRISYRTLSRVGFDKSFFSVRETVKIPELYLRFFSNFWLIGQVAFCLDFPRVISKVLRFDPRIASMASMTGIVPEANIMAAKYDPKMNRLSFELRISDREGFLAVTTLKHYADCLIKEIAEFWRQHHRMYPPLVLSLEFPLWPNRDISGNYLTVETTPIVKLLMGRTMYGDTPHIWFRELLQNALDANATRQALQPSDSASSIAIHHDGDRMCTIRDRGIGMSYQHIIRYLTTLGRSIWTSDELEELGDEALPQVVGKFGIGFVSVFQDAESVSVRTKFFRDIGEDGWLVQFTSVEKPFFIEYSPYDSGTEVEVCLRKRLSTRMFATLVNQFFLYIAEEINITPKQQIPKHLEGVELVSPRFHENGIFWDNISQQQIGNTQFSLRTLFCYSYKKRDKKDALPGSYLQICNSGVKVFDQSTLFLKPGKRYIWMKQDEQEHEFYWPKDKELLNHFWVVLDFKKGASPVLPSRMEIDIDEEFSDRLLETINRHFCDGLESTLRQFSSRSRSPRELRRRLLKCLLFPIREERTYHYGAKEAPRSFCGAEIIQEAVIALYRELCPLRIVSLSGDEKFMISGQLDSWEPSIFVPDELAKTALFKIYVRSLRIQKWISVESDREYFLADTVLRPRGWKGIFNDRDIYKESAQLFTEKTDSSLTRIIRGDYALVDSDIFGSAAYLRLPSNLSGSWKRAEAMKYPRSKVLHDCPARVLLNVNHPLFVLLEEFLDTLAEPTDEKLADLRLALNALADSVIEVRNRAVAEQAWSTIRQDLARVTGKPFEGISYRSLVGAK